MNKILIYDKNRAFARFINIALSNKYQIERFSVVKKEKRVEFDNYVVCIFIFYDLSDAIDLVKIVKNIKNVIICTESKRIYQYCDIIYNDFFFIDLQNRKVEISKSIKNFLELIEKN